MVFKKKKYGGSSGCRSENIMPKDCETKKDYKLQSLIFHPDKNKDCSAEATQKFQYFQNLPSCILVKDQQNNEEQNNEEPPLEKNSPPTQTQEVPSNELIEMLQKAIENFRVDETIIDTTIANLKNYELSQRIPIYKLICNQINKSFIIGIDMKYFRTIDGLLNLFAKIYNIDNSIQNYISPGYWGNFTPLKI